MRALAFIALACAACSGSPAKSTRPEARPPAEVAKPAPAPAMEAASYRLTFVVELEHGCSQSHESRGTDGTLVLEIDERGRATLTVDARYTSTVGPSFSQFQQGHQDFYSIHNKEQAVWTGTAERTPKRIDVTFDHVEHALVEWAEHGDPDLPEPTGSDSSLELACRFSPTRVYDPVKEDTYFWQVEDETPASREVLLCRPSSPLFEGYDDMILIEDAFPLLDGAGLALESSVMFYSERLVLRLAAP